MLDREKIIIISGVFDPLSLEELRYLQRCKRKGDWLGVGLHSDIYLQWALGGFVQNFDMRREIIKNLKCVDEIFTFDDTDGTVCQLLKLVKIAYPYADITYVSQDDMFNMPESKIRGITFETMK